MITIRLQSSLMEYKDIIECEDGYEAEKLSAFLTKQKDDSSLIRAIKVRDNELVITLADKSSHCIVLRDEVSASNLTKIMNEIINGKGELYSSRFEGARLHIEYRLE
jgi:hypothetical protein